MLISKELLEQIPNTMNPVTNALSHGMFYIYVVQPLVSSGQVSTSVEFNVYISAGDDFEYYGYSTQNYQPLIRTSTPLFQAQSIMVEPSQQENLTNQEHPVQIDNPKNFRPIVSTREFIRRFAHVGTLDTATHNIRPAEHDTVTVKVSDLFQRFSILASNNSSDYNVNFQRIIRQFYLGHTGGLKFKFHFYNCQDAQVKYVPPTMTTAVAGSRRNNIAAFAEPTDDDIYNDRWIEFNNYPWDDTLNGDVWSPPFIETGTWAKPYMVLPDDVSGENMSTSQIQIECTIPNMNCVEFIGDKSWYQVVPSSSQGYEPFSSAMGDFVLTTLARNSREETLPNIKGRVVIYMAYADEARLGYNVCCPVIRPLRFDDDGFIRGAGYENETDTTIPITYAPLS